jgi:hypothetical protein
LENIILSKEVSNIDIAEAYAEEVELKEVIVKKWVEV